MITQDRFAAAQRHPWLPAIYYHDEVVRRTFADSAVTADSDITTPHGALDSPDGLLDGAPLDMVPDTPVSRRIQPERLQAVPDQLLTYQPATAEFLNEIFTG